MIRICCSSAENIPTVFRIIKLKREDIFISCEDIFSYFPQLLSISEKVVCVCLGGGGPLSPSNHSTIVPHSCLLNPHPSQDCLLKETEAWDFCLQFFRQFDPSAKLFRIPVECSQGSPEFSTLQNKIPMSVSLHETWIPLSSLHGTLLQRVLSFHGTLLS